MEPKIDKAMMFRPAQEQAVFMLISRQEIEDNDINGTLTTLRDIVGSADREYIWQFKSTFTLVFDGYDADPRELYEIPEVCNYVAQLNEAFPYWFFFLSLADESLIIFLLCSTSALAIAPRRAYSPSERIRTFLYSGFDGINELFDTYNYPIEELTLLTNGIIEVIGNAIESE